MRSAVLSFTSMVVFFLSGCGSSEAILGTIGNEKISLSEYEEMYVKNNGGWEKAAASTLQQRKDFLDLFVKYKLKLLEARNLGLEKDSAIVAELDNYRTTMAASYVLEREMIEPGLRKLYDRRAVDLKASHILLRVKPNASPDDTLAVYLKAKNLIARAEKVRFDSLAHAFSEDPGSAANGGDLGWFTQGRMVKEFEDAAYALKPGQITQEPVRTSFGYHIIKLTGRELNKGAFEVAHILRRFAPNLSDSTAVRDTIEMVYGLLKQGKISWAEAVDRFSDDPSSKVRGGTIGSYERVGLPGQIADIFLKTPVDSISSPYRAPYGYHIFKIVAVHPLPGFEEMKQQLRQQYQQTQYTTDYENYVAGLNNRYHLNFDVNLRQKIVTSFDSTKTPTSTGWRDRFDESLLDRPLFTYTTKKFTVRQFLDRLTTSPEFNGTKLTPGGLDDIIDRIAESTILAEHNASTGSSYPEFEKLMNEYEKGVLIFRVDQDAVWNKAEVTDSVLLAYYNSTKADWLLPDRVNIGEVHVPTDSVANIVYEKLLRGADFGEIAREYTTRPGYKEKHGAWGLMAYTATPLQVAAATMDVDSLAPPIKFEGAWSVIKVLEKEKARPKTFEEVKPYLTKILQNRRVGQLEDEWIEGLKKKYNAEIHDDVLSRAFKRKIGEGS